MAADDRDDLLVNKDTHYTLLILFVLMTLTIKMMYLDAGAGGGGGRRPVAERK